MNAVEIESAISDLADQPFDAAEFPYQFLAAFGHKDVALQRLRKGNNNASDVPGALLLRNHIHLCTCASGQVGASLAALRASAATAKAKAKFILATDGQTLEAEAVATGSSGETIACNYPNFANHFGFFLPLAGISTVKEIKDNPIDVRATGRLNKLYVELLKENPSWATPERRHDMNHFMARLIFCFFAEDTDIFCGEGLFTQTVDQFSESDGSNTHQVLGDIFRSMNVQAGMRHLAEPRLPNWANGFPYVNGGLFGGSCEVPRFTRMARTYLMHAGSLQWRHINPDIFGSMIQAVADDAERGALGMHYTSVPNILKVLNPLFLDDLRSQLDAAGDNRAKLLNLRKRMARIRVFDPACGSGNFLVIAYKQMREIEAQLNQRRGEADLRSTIPLTNFRGIELRDFPAEIARLALVIAEFQCDVLHRGQKEALNTFLPLKRENWIVCGNALRLDWLSVCEPTEKKVQLRGDGLFDLPSDQFSIDFENEGGETFICGNPPYRGVNRQSIEQKDDLRLVFDGKLKSWKSLDYVAGWFFKSAEYANHSTCSVALVSTNSICQGHHVPNLWPTIFSIGHQITFAFTSFKWANLAQHNAGVTVAIVGFSKNEKSQRRIFSTDAAGIVSVKTVENINAYLVAGPSLIVEKTNIPLAEVGVMNFGNHPYYAMPLIFSNAEALEIVKKSPEALMYMRPYYGSQEFISSAPRVCFWINDSNFHHAQSIDVISTKLQRVVIERQAAKNDKTAQLLAATPYRFREANEAFRYSLIVPIVSSESREYLPVGLLGKEAIVSYLAFAMYDAPMWHFALLVSLSHLVWIGTVCSKLETRYRYSNTLGWNTFPVPPLSDQNKADLTACAENILLAREAHFPATIADLYDPEHMPANLRAAHEANDECLERIYIGRRFKNDTERLEKLFELYTQMTAAKNSAKNSAKASSPSQASTPAGKGKKPNKASRNQAPWLDAAGHA